MKTFKIVADAADACNQVEEIWAVSKITPTMPQGGHDTEILTGTSEEVEADYRSYHEYEGELCIERNW